MLDSLVQLVADKRRNSTSEISVSCNLRNHGSVRLLKFQYSATSEIPVWCDIWNIGMMWPLKYQSGATSEISWCGIWNRSVVWCLKYRFGATCEISVWYNLFFCGMVRPLKYQFGATSQISIRCNIWNCSMVRRLKYRSGATSEISVWCDLWNINIGRPLKSLSVRYLKSRSGATSDISVWCDLWNLGRCDLWNLHPKTEIRKLETGNQTLKTETRNLKTDIRKLTTDNWKLISKPEILAPDFPDFSDSYKLRSRGLSHTFLFQISSLSNLSFIISHFSRQRMIISNLWNKMWKPTSTSDARNLKITAFPMITQVALIAHHQMHIHNIWASIFVQHRLNNLPPVNIFDRRRNECVRSVWTVLGKAVFRWKTLYIHARTVSQESALLCESALYGKLRYMRNRSYLAPMITASQAPMITDGKRMHVQKGCQHGVIPCLTRTQMGFIASSQSANPGPAMQSRVVSY